MLRCRLKTIAETFRLQPENLCGRMCAVSPFYTSGIMMFVLRLLEFIESHGNRAKFEEGKLYGEVLISKDGEVWYEWEEIAPNIKSVRDWLGY